MATTAPGKSSRPRRVDAKSAEAASPALGHARLAELVMLADDGRVMVRTDGMPPVAAQILGQVTVEALAAARVQGHPVMVVPLDGDRSRLVVIGVVAHMAPAVRPPAMAKIDGRRVELTGADEVVLTCGKASITLTKAGKVIIKGTYVSAGATGLHRITGGSVQIN